MDYTLKFSKRKTISIKINNAGDVEVFAPYSTSKDRVELLLLQKKAWILKHQARIKMIINSNLQVVNKEKAYLFGELIDYTESTVNYLKYTAKNYLITRCLELSQALKLPINSVKTKNFKSRWGSCDINNNITLNYRLIMLPKDAIDYVIIHELCHTLEFNHQKGFHKLLKDLSVNERAHKNTLKYFNFLLKIEY